MPVKNKPKHDKKGIILTIALALTLVLVGVLFKTLIDVSNSVLAVQKEVKEISSTISKNPAGESMESAVLEAINSMERKKVKDIVDAKHAKYQLAVEATNDSRSIYGSESARFTLVEFSDLECPFCRKFHDTPKEIVDASDGAVNWEWKHFPLGFHNPMATNQAIAAECVREDAGNRAFWVFLDEVFTKSRSNGQGLADLDDAVISSGASPTNVMSCIQSGKYKEKVQADIALGQRQGVNGTPATFIVDNKTGRAQMLSGAQPAEAIVAVIKRMIADEKEESEYSDNN